MIDLGETTNLSADSAGGGFGAVCQHHADVTGNDFDQAGVCPLLTLGNNLRRPQKADIVSMGTRLAGAGKQVKMSEANIMALAASMASVGIEAEMGGSAMSKVMLNIDMDVARGGNAVAKYAKVAGQSAKTFRRRGKQIRPRLCQASLPGLAAVGGQGRQCGADAWKTGLQGSQDA